MEARIRAKISCSEPAHISPLSCKIETATCHSEE